MSQVLSEKKDHIGTLTLNRPERLNAITAPMLEAFSESLVAFDRDDDVRVIIITGAGRGFCAGLDSQDQLEGKGFNAESGQGCRPGRLRHGSDTGV